MLGTYTAGECPSCSHPPTLCPSPCPSLILQPLTAALLAKAKQNSRGKAGLASPASGFSRRVVGVVEEPDSEEEGPSAGANPFDLCSSDEEVEEGAGVVDR